MSIKTNHEDLENNEDTGIILKQDNRNHSILESTRVENSKEEREVEIRDGRARFKLDQVRLYTMHVLLNYIHTFTNMNR